VGLAEAQNANNPLIAHRAFAQQIAAELEVHSVDALEVVYPSVFELGGALQFVDGVAITVPPGARAAQYQEDLGLFGPG
jgi:hypothetical protein